MSSKWLKQFRNNQEGSIYIYMALAAIPLLGFLGLSVDMGRAYHEQSIIEGAVDAAAMAAARVASGNASSEATRVFNAYIAGTSAEAHAHLDEVAINSEEGYVEASASSDVPMSLLKLVGESTRTVHGKSRVLTEKSFTEVAIAIDNSIRLTDRSEGVAQLACMKGSITRFVDDLFRGQPVPEDTFISIIPFVSQVNVGRRPSWLNKEGLRSIRDRARFPRGAGEWNGCVEARLSSRLHFRDIPPLNQLTKFYPYRWASTEIEKYPISDKRRNRAPLYASATVKPWSVSEPGDNDWSQVHISPLDSVAPVNPNAGCPAEALPLTNQKSDIMARLSGMFVVSRGGTFLFTGLQWGLRTLSPRWRGVWDCNSNGLPKDYSESKKVLMLIARGGNDWKGSGAPWQAYGDRNYTSFGRWYGRDHASLNQRVLTPRSMNGYTLRTCGFIKRRGIEIYTITFGNSDSATLSMMQSCASSPDHFYNPMRCGELANILTDINGKIEKLRYSWPNKA